MSRRPGEAPSVSVHTPPTLAIGVRLPASTVAELRAVATRTGCSVNRLIRQALEIGLPDVFTRLDPAAETDPPPRICPRCRDSMRPGRFHRAHGQTYRWICNRCAHLEA